MSILRSAVATTCEVSRGLARITHQQFLGRAHRVRPLAQVHLAYRIWRPHVPILRRSAAVGLTVRSRRIPPKPTFSFLSQPAVTNTCVPLTSVNSTHFTGASCAATCCEFVPPAWTSYILTALSQPAENNRDESWRRSVWGVNSGESRCCAYALTLDQARSKTGPSWLYIARGCDCPELSTLYRRTWTSQRRTIGDLDFDSTVLSTQSRTHIVVPARDGKDGLGRREFNVGYRIGGRLDELNVLLGGAEGGEHGAGGRDKG